ncbi:MAG: glycosyltransferase family 2 protein [Magnetococcales bacterium]|nr:glycosyltransferase family 2 protein [Magnetococcales bacterium]
MNEGKNPICCFIIVSYNSGHYLSSCLRSIQEQNETDFQVIVVDNNSTDNSKDAIPLEDPRFTLMDMQKNCGFAQANNLAAAKTKAPYIATINPDTYLAANWLTNMLAAAKPNSQVTALGSELICMDDHNRWDGMGDAYSIAGFAWRGGHKKKRVTVPAIAETFSSCAAASLYNRAVFMDLGGFDEEYFCYCEDVDLGFRMRLAGYAILQVNTTFAYHAGSAISGPKSPFSLYHATRNTIWTLFKNMPPALLIISLLPHIILNIAKVLFERCHKARAARWRGVWHGFKGAPRIIRKRVINKSQRRCTVWQLAKRFCWSPVTPLKRGIVLFPPS